VTHGAQGEAPAPPALPSLSIVIPALEAAASLPGCLEALREAVPGEIWLVDGGSRDETRSIAAAAGCRLAAARRGRGRQLQAGAALASGPWLLFLHADTRLSSGWGRQVADFIRAADAPAGAAAFRLRLPPRAAGRPPRGGGGGGGPAPRGGGARATPGGAAGGRRRPRPVRRPPG